MKFVAVGVIVSSLVRFTWDLFQSIRKSRLYIEELKDYREYEDKSWFWYGNA